MGGSFDTRRADAKDKAVSHDEVDHPTCRDGEDICDKIVEEGPGRDGASET